VSQFVFGAWSEFIQCKLIRFLTLQPGKSLALRCRWAD
jgi:hypothetical protein